MVIWLGKSLSAAAERASPLILGWKGVRSLLQGLVLGSATAEFRVCSIGTKRVNKHRRPDLDDPAGATEVHLYRSSSVATLLTLKRRLRIVACLLRSIVRMDSRLLEG